MGAVAVVLVVLIGSVIALVAALGRLSAAYDRVTGAPPAARRTAPWMRSLRGERTALRAEGRAIGTIERLVVLSVLACAIAFNVWFFFLAGSSLPSS
jgi:hypothetical protein